MHPGEIWNGRSLGARLAQAALYPASLLYAAGWEAYLLAYRLGLKKPSEPHFPVICIGNLLVGGGGKTPITLHLARALREMGYEVVVSASGYGSSRAEAATLAPIGRLDPKEWGDEPAMLRWLVPDLPLIVGRRRVLAAEICHREFPNAVLLMDDGFQHLPLKKHVSIVMDPADPKNSFCLPAGPYREPRWNRSRANTVLPGEFKVVMGPHRFVDPDGNETTPVKPAVMCALARPEQFALVLQAMGIEASRSLYLPDHDPLDAGNLFDGIPPDCPVLVTAKDWVKLRERPDVHSRPFIIALQRMGVEPREEFREWLRTQLDAKADQISRP